MEYSYYLKFSQKLKLCEISLVFFWEGGATSRPFCLLILETRHNFDGALVAS